MNIEAIELMGRCVWNFNISHLLLIDTEWYILVTV